MNPLSVYVAGSSNQLELDRIKRWSAACVQRNIIVTSTWPAIVAVVGHGNPREATRAQRRAWARKCLAEVRAADVAWLLVPSLDCPTRGAWWECGYAYAYCDAQTLILSGDTSQSIFSALGDEFATDELAFDSLCMMAARRQEPR